MEKIISIKKENGEWIRVRVLESDVQGKSKRKFSFDGGLTWSTLSKAYRTARDLGKLLIA